MPPAHAQLPSVALRAIVAAGPKAPAMQAKAYEVAPATGEGGFEIARG